MAEVTMPLNRITKLKRPRKPSGELSRRMASRKRPTRIQALEERAHSHTVPDLIDTRAIYTPSTPEESLRLFQFNNTDNTVDDDDDGSLSVVDDEPGYHVVTIQGTSPPPPPLLNDRSHDRPDSCITVDLTTDSGVEDDEVIDLTSSRTSDSIRPLEVSIGYHQPDDVITISPTIKPAPILNISRRSRPQAKPPSKRISSHRTRPADIKCPVCLDTRAQFEAVGRKLVTTTCGHVFCNQCVRNSITTMHRCPTCRKKLTLKQYHELYL